MTQAIERFEVQPIGYVRITRPPAGDDAWRETTATIALTDEFTAESLDGLSAFSHAEVLFVLNQIDPLSVVTGSRHPRDDTRYPRVGIFAQRGAMRPNRLGATMVQILAVEGRTLKVRELDALDGTPVLDIKPVMCEFLPREPVVQPEWASALMRGYFSS